MKIDWYGSESHLLLNPRMPGAEQGRLESILRGVPPLPGHVWIATSGTSGSLKLTALSKEALLASADAVNRHLGAASADVWVSVLPEFHVGGLGIQARATLSGSKVLAFDWDPVRFASESFTLSALVPAQVRDLVAGGLRASPRVRAVVVGGGAMGADLYNGARALGWPVLPSYGLTEACSQVATAGLGSPELKILPHLQVKIASGRIALRGNSLLTGYGSLEESGRAQFLDPKVDGWFTTEDLGLVAGDFLEVYGRAGEFVKIGGESVDLSRLDSILDSVRGRLDAAVVAMPDLRLGLVVHLAVASEPGSLAEEFNQRVLPFERIRRVHRVDAVPRTELGKLLRTRLEEMLEEAVSESPHVVE